MIRRFAGILYILICFFTVVSAQDFGFPHGVEREWTARDGSKINAKFEMEIKSPQVTEPDRRFSFRLITEDGKRLLVSPYPSWGGFSFDLSPEDKAWIRDAIFRTDHASAAEPDPAVFKNPDGDLDRTTFQWVEVEGIRSAGQFPAAMARFALWWDSVGYLSLGRGDDPAEKLGDFFRAFDRHFSDRENAAVDFDLSAREVGDYFRSEYDEPVVMSSVRVIHFSPRHLSHYADGRNATLLKLFTYKKGDREYYWRLPLLSADKNGNVELEMHGNLIRGMLKPIDPNDGWKVVPPSGSWEIEILNRAEIGTNSIDDDTRLVVTSEVNGSDLWVFRPWVVTDKTHLAVAPPPIMPPPLEEEAKRETAVAEAAPFDLRKEWKFPSLRFAVPSKFERRSWKRTDGKSVDAVFAGLSGQNDVDLVELDLGKEKAMVATSELVEEDATYAKFAGAEQGLRLIDTGRLVYELRESREKASLLELHFEPGKVTASLRDASEEEKKTSLLDKAIDLVAGSEEIEVDYTALKFSFPSGESGDIPRQELIGQTRNSQDDALRPFVNSTPVVHNGWPCREVNIPSSHPTMGSSQFERTLRVSRLGPPEVAFFWRYFIRHSEISGRFGPLAGFMEGCAQLGLVPVDLIYKNSRNPSQIFRVQLLEAEFGV